ncbi:MAG: efflux RND transporter permease subunit, partial [Candidatus Binatia bacterium]
RTLGAFMRVRWVVFPLLLGVAGLIVLAGLSLPRELAPLEDRSNMRVTVRGPEGASYEFMQHHMDRLALYLKERVPEVERALAIAGWGGMGVNNGLIVVYLADPATRKRSQEEVFRQISREFEEFSAVRAFPAQPPTIGDRRAGQPVQYVLQAATLEEVEAVLPKFLEEAAASPVLRFVDADLKVNRPEGSIAIDRRRAAELGVSVRDVARTLQLAYGGVRLGYFLMRGRQYQVIGQVNREDRNDPRDLSKLYVRTSSGAMVSLGNLVTFSETVSPAAIYRFNRFTSATISAGLAPGYAVGDGIRALDEVAARVLPSDVRTSLAGQSRDFAESSSSLLFAFALALVVVYLVLAAQFESFVDPLIILVTVPMSLAGALASLALFGQTLNVFSQIGMIMLIGLVAKNGILIVEFANQRKRSGLSVTDAVVDAARARLRPVLMTALSTILGILPIALALGTSAGSRRPLGIAVVGGLVFSSALTLYVVPAVYSYFSRAGGGAERDEAGVGPPAPADERRRARA